MQAIIVHLSQLIVCHLTTFLPAAKQHGHTVGVVGKSDEARRLSAIFILLEMPTKMHIESFRFPIALQA